MTEVHNWLEEKTCESCGKQATSACVDVVRYWPRCVNEQVYVYTTCKAEGDPHYYCDDHYRPGNIRHE